MKSLLGAALVAGLLVAARPAAAHVSFSLGFGVPVYGGPVYPVPVYPGVPVAPPCAWGAPYPYPVYGPAFGYGPHWYGQPRYFDNYYGGAWRRPRIQGYTFR